MMATTNRCAGWCPTASSCVPKPPSEPSRVSVDPFRSTRRVLQRNRRSCGRVRVATDDRRDAFLRSGAQRKADDKFAALEQEFGLGECFSFEDGPNGAPCVRLRHPNGSSACIDLHGANVTSWRKPDGKELLHTPDAQRFGFTGTVTNRGGISLAFPQYGEGRLPRDGLLHDLDWEIIGTEMGDFDGDFDPAPGICMRATDTPETQSKWPFKFEVQYQVNLMEMDDFMPDKLGPHYGDPDWDEKYEVPNPYEDRPDEVPEDDETDIWAPEIEQQLRFLLLVKNTGDKPMSFTTGIRPLFAVKDLSLFGKFARVLGLGAKYYLDYTNTAVPKVRVWPEDFISFGGREVDSVHVDVFGKHEVLFCPGDRSYFSVFNRDGFKDVALWSPYESMPFAAQNFVSVGSARVARVVTLQPGEEWYAESAYRSHDTYWDQLPVFMKNPGILEDMEHPTHMIGNSDD